MLGSAEKSAQSTQPRLAQPDLPSDAYIRLQLDGTRSTLSAHGGGIIGGGDGGAGGEGGAGGGGACTEPPSQTQQIVLGEFSPAHS